MLKIVLLGCGWHSINHHAPALARFSEEHPDTISVTACDVDESRARACSETCGFSGYNASPSSLVNAGFDAAVVVLPAPLLRETAEAWLARGIPILLEKPLGRSYKEACQITELPGVRGRVTVSLNRRFDPGLNCALEWAAGLSPARFIHGSMLRVNRTEEDFLWSTSIHLLDAMCYTAGPLKISPDTARIVDSPGRCGRVALLEGENGLRGSAEILPACGRIEERIELSGAGWHVRVWTGTSHPWRVEAYQAGALVLQESAPPDDPEFSRNGTYRETCLFLEAVLSQNPAPRPWPEDALPATALAEQLQEMSRGR
jgi:predicted dehydrogenase